MAQIPSSSQIVAVPTTTDWIAVSKTICIEAAFLGSVGAIITGHGSPEIIQLAGATGLALGVLRITDVIANIANVRAFLSKPLSGVVPQGVGTPLIKTPFPDGANGAPPPTINSAPPVQ